MPATDQTMTQMCFERNADRERRLMVVGDGAQRTADARLLEEHGERRDQHARHHGGHQVELLDQHLSAADRDGEAAVAHAELIDGQGLDVAAPEQLAEAFEEEGDADGRHEQDDVGLVDQRAQDQALDGEGEHDHHRDGQDERGDHRRNGGQARRAQHRLEADQGQRGEQHHDALGEVEHARCLEDQDEAERHQRIHDAGHEPADDDLEQEHGVARHIGERSGDAVEDGIHGVQSPPPTATRSRAGAGARSAGSSCDTPR